MTSPNPNPALVTDPLWNVWVSVRDGAFGLPGIPGVRLSGIYADTRFYHNTRRRLYERGFNSSNNYSLRLSNDLEGPDDKASAIDLTLSDYEMRKRTVLLRASAIHQEDDRLFGFREFIGTLDNQKVYCRIAGNEGLGQSHGSDDWSRDETHLWHIHSSVLRKYVNNPRVMEGFVSVILGETWEEWLTRQEGEMDVNEGQKIEIPDWSWVKTHPKFKDRTRVQDGLLLNTILVESWAGSDLMRMFYDEERARDAVLETIVKEMSAAIKAGGGSVDTAAILQGTQAQLDAFRADVARAAQAQADAMRAALDAATGTEAGQ